MGERGLKILDVGCGTGYRTHVLSNKCKQTMGIDISRTNIKLARKRYPNTKFLRMNAENMKFEDSSFDRIYAVDVLEHVDELKKVLKELARVIKEGGKLFVEIPGEKSERWLLRLRPTFHKEIHHVRIFNNGDLEESLKKLGFKMLKMKPNKFLQHVELYYTFKTKEKSNAQTDIGSWDDDYLSKIVHATVSMFDPYWVFNTPLKFFPAWIVTLPIGCVVNYFGNKIMPKTIFYEFQKE